MLIDLLLIVAWIIAVFKGLSKGFIVALFSVAGFVIGIAAALALSAKVAEKLSSTADVSGKWLPALSFLLVFLVVAVLVSLAAKTIQRTAEMALLGGVNRVAGAVAYVFLYSVILSVLMFYLVALKIVSEETVSHSRLYFLIKPLAPWIIDKLGEIIPMFKNMFEALKLFFEQAGNNLEHA